MAKKLIRLTESDLHRIVKESVQKILNEVKYDGISYHGNNPYDWDDLSNIRDEKAEKAQELMGVHGFYSNSEIKDLLIRNKISKKEAENLLKRKKNNELATDLQNAIDHHEKMSLKDKNNMYNTPGHIGGYNRYRASQHFKDVSNVLRDKDKKAKYAKLSKDILGDEEGRRNKQNKE